VGSARATVCRVWTRHNQVRVTDDVEAADPK
jgi:hypothetical protein